MTRKESKAGYFIRERRLANQLDQKTLAKRAGTSPSQVSRIERGAISPSIDTVERLLAAMDEELTLSARKKPEHSSSSILFSPIN